MLVLMQHQIRLLVQERHCLYKPSRRIQNILNHWYYQLQWDLLFCQKKLHQFQPILR